METFAAAWNAVTREPMAVVMAILAIVLVIIAVSIGVRLRNRVFALMLAVISGVTAWMMAARWRWPH
jgi:hypothetical protein